MQTNECTMNYFKFIIFSINFYIILINGLENNYYLSEIDHFRPQNDTATVFVSFKLLLFVN